MFFFTYLFIIICSCYNRPKYRCGIEVRFITPTVKADENIPKVNFEYRAPVWFGHWNILTNEVETGFLGTKVYLKTKIKKNSILILN